MARIILLLSGAIVTIVALPMYFLLCLWIAIFEEYERRRKNEKEEREHGKKKDCEESNKR